MTSASSCKTSKMLADGNDHEIALYKHQVSFIGTINNKSDWDIILLNFLPLGIFAFIQTNFPFTDSVCSEIL